MTEQSFKKPLVFADTKEQSKGMKQRLNCRIRLGQKKKKKNLLWVLIVANVYTSPRVAEVKCPVWNCKLLKGRSKVSTLEGKP